MVAQIVLAPIAGVLIGALGVGPAFAFNAGSYVISAAVLRGLDVPSRPVNRPIGGWLAVRAGLQTAKCSALLTRLAMVQVSTSLSAGATSGLLVVLAGDWLGIGASGFGMQLGCIGVGAAAGPLLLRRLIRPGDKCWLFGPYTLRGGVDLILAGVGSPVVAGLSWRLMASGPRRAW